MQEYECKFSVNGVRTKLVIKARSQIEAKKLVEMQYQGCKIMWYSVVRIY